MKRGLLLSSCFGSSIRVTDCDDGSCWLVLAMIHDHGGFDTVSLVTLGYFLLLLFFARYLCCDLVGGLAMLAIRVTPLDILSRSDDLLLGDLADDLKRWFSKMMLGLALLPSFSSRL